jgi:hypothetical protein
MDPKYFYMYILAVSLSFVAFTFIKCYYKIDAFDSFFYTSDTMDTSIYSYTIYYLSHFVFYFVFGLLFSFEILVPMVFKTIGLEFALIVIKNCFTSIEGVESAITSIIVGLLSYIMGCVFYNIYYGTKNY